MSSKSKIRYVPRHQGGRPTKDQRPERLHGAFTGGFSAGHFNTVATPGGWRPTENVNTEEYGSQNLEDFMDEQDHNEWGGPQSVRQDLVGRTLTAEPDSVQTATLLTESIFGGKELTPTNVGSKLLKKMGWRQGSSSAIVPSDETRMPSRKDDKEWQYLSERRLKKIKVQQEHIRIPQPKLDQVGLGFDAHANAPEFQKFREKRRRLAQERARGNHRSVYRLSNILDNDELGDASSSSRKGNHLQDDDADREHNYESYEVVEDFVGSRTVGGFALHDDEDDAFDDTTKSLTKVSDKILLDKEEYNTVIEDPQSDDDSYNNNPPRQANDLAKSLLAWTDTATQPETTSRDGEHTTTVMTSDGRPPLPGFVLGGSGGGTLHRFRGPDIPDNYEVSPHVFRDDEHPLVWKTLARAVQLENDNARKEAHVKDALASGRIQKRVTPQQPDVSAPLAGAAFSSLGVAMKSKFTTGSESTNQENEKLRLSAGLVQASEIPKIRTSTDSSNNDARRILPVARTAQSFMPTPLLCKRFGVRTPAMNSTALVVQKETQTSAEEYFFRNEVVPAFNRASAKSAPDNASTEREEDEGTSTPHVYADRPAMDVYRSIFGSQDSESDNDEDFENILDPSRTCTKNMPSLAEAHQSEKSKEPQARRSRDSDVDSTTFLSDGQGHEKQKKTWSSDSSEVQSSDESRKKSTKESRKRKKKDRKKKKHRKRDRSIDESNTPEHERKRKRRYHRHKEARKKHDKSRHRKKGTESE